MHRVKSQCNEVSLKGCSSSALPCFTPFHSYSRATPWLKIEEIGFRAARQTWDRINNDY